MLWWLRVAPFGNPVVPEVYWMLIASSKPSVAARSSSAALSTGVDSIASHSDEPRYTTVSSAGQSPRTSSTIAR